MMDSFTHFSQNYVFFSRLGKEGGRSEKLISAGFLRKDMNDKNMVCNLCCGDWLQSKGIFQRFSFLPPLLISMFMEWVKTLELQVLKVHCYHQDKSFLKREKVLHLCWKSKEELRTRFKHNHHGTSHNMLWNMGPSNWIQKYCHFVHGKPSIHH